MTLDTLLSPIAQALQETLTALEAGAELHPLALRRAARLAVLAALYRAAPRPILLLVDRPDHALTLLDELALWLPDAPKLYFPEPNPLFYENAPWGETTRRDRLAVLTALAAYHLPGGQSAIGNPQSPIIVASLRAVMCRTMPRRDYLKVIKTLKRGQVARPDELARSWVALGYEAVNIVTAAGQFSRRGGILDLWPPAEPQPLRIEFFGDEIDTLRRFDPASQRTTATLEKALVTPAREYLAPEILATPISEYFIPTLHPPASALDYLPRSGLVLIDDRQILADTAAEIEEQAVSLRADQLKDGTLPESFPAPYLSWGELEDILPDGRTLELGGPVFATEGDSATQRISESADQPGTKPISPAPRPPTPIPQSPITHSFLPETRSAGRLRNAMEYLVEVAGRGERVIIVSRQSARLQELWQEQAPGASHESPVFLEGSLTEGFTFTPLVSQKPVSTSSTGALPLVERRTSFAVETIEHSQNAVETNAPFHLLTDGELFGWRRPEARLRAHLAAEAPEAAYADLQPGDWVVHMDHGVGRLVGLVRRTVDGIEREYLAVEYADEAQLFVPVYQADRLTRYVGPDNREPSPSRLSSGEWKTDKEKAQAAAEQVAHELLDLYATRQVVSGYAFASDTPWQQELEASFPYVETPDQLRVLSEVERDMETPRPMDRLLCGDVGYGKTEVALRAAFKAVMDGKQVAVLVPTTVLAQQHYHTFRDRLAAFPVTVEMLSRFRNPQQQREIVYKLAQGAIDIVIGTHRLISGDVLFKDLGLLIIDEEQRFGVAHKEMLKRLRTEVDVLTLTATPIPRTLYMALTGVRDISTLNTPPEERLPIVTHVGPFNPKIVRQAIVRELERGGQIYFVHNRVQTIEGMASHLRKLVPEAWIAIGHGQLDEQSLADRMDAFSAGESDILLCTTIIESGLDIPNCNTLIVDRADTFGLAQLYQLRGRVGRGAQRAYAYFFRHNKINPTHDGRQRLETIAENTQLGAGFSIAMRDLEIRGAGEILGTRQSGYIAAVGFHLYTRLLANAVRRLRIAQPGRPDDGRTPFSLLLGDAPLGMPINVDLPLPVGLPPEYIPDQEMRLRLYRRLADLRALPEVDALADEFADRFGPPPEDVRNLLYQVRVKLMAEQAGLAGVSTENAQIGLRYPPLPDGVNARDFSGLPDLSGFGVRKGKNTLWMPVADGLMEGWQKRLAEVLEKLA